MAPNKSGLFAPTHGFWQISLKRSLYVKNWKKPFLRPLFRVTFPFNTDLNSSSRSPWDPLGPSGTTLGGPRGSQRRNWSWSSMGKLLEIMVQATFRFRDICQKPPENGRAGWKSPHWKTVKTFFLKKPQSCDFFENCSKIPSWFPKIWHFYLYRDIKFTLKSFPVQCENICNSVNILKLWEFDETWCLKKST